MEENTMETERLVIRRFQKSDWRGLYEYLSNGDVVKYEPYDVFDENQCVKEAERRAADDAFWAVCLKDGRLVGNLYFAQVEPERFSTWEIGYVFNPLFYGNGYATESAGEMLKYGFEHLRTRRVIAKCNPLNIASWKLMERLNMRREAHQLQTVYFKLNKDGSPIWHDTFQYALLAEEWRSHQRFAGGNDRTII